MFTSQPGTIKSRYYNTHRVEKQLSWKFDFRFAVYRKTVQPPPHTHIHTLTFHLCHSAHVLYSRPVCCSASLPIWWGKLVRVHCPQGLPRLYTFLSDELGCSQIQNFKSTSASFTDQLSLSSKVHTERWDLAGAQARTSVWLACPSPFVFASTLSGVRKVAWEQPSLSLCVTQRSEENNPVWIEEAEGLWTRCTDDCILPALRIGATNSKGSCSLPAGFWQWTVVQL